MKKGFAGAILQYNKLVIIVFVAATLVCAVLQSGVGVNYNMVDYLPEDAVSTVSLHIMNGEFTQTVPNARVMIPDVTIQEALSYKQRLSEIDGVSGLLWLDDVADVMEPLEVQDPAFVKEYYKDGTALMSLTIRATEEVRIVNEIRELIGENGAVSGEAVGSATYQELSVAESTKAIAFLVPIILLILVACTTSYMEPILFLASIGVAVLLNMGTNLIFGEVSYITFSISPILQMAVSLDYAIFLLHSFENFRMQTDDIREAMRLAMLRSFPSVMASALTTLLGFLVLLLMRFRLGADLGLNLAKGIAFSLLTSMVFLPALTLGCVKWIDKTRHRSIMPSFRRIGRWILKARIPALAIVLLLVVPCYLAQQQNTFTYGTGELDRGKRAGQDEQRIEEAFGKSTPLVVLVPRGDVARETALANELAAIPHITSVLSYARTVGAEIPLEYLSEAIVSQFYSEHYARIILYAATPYEGDVAFAVVEQVRATAKKYYDNPLSCGQSVNLYDMRDVVTSDNTLVNLLALFTIGLVLMGTFKSVSLPFILLLTIETAIWLNLATPYFSSTPLCYIGYLVISTVQLGATVDYAILFTDHYLANRRQYLPGEAARTTVCETMGSILISGSILSSAGFMIGIVSTNEIVSELGTLIGRGALLSVLLVLVFLPAALTLLDRGVALTTVNSNFVIKRRSL